ncbi:protein ABCI12, chloroplastic isoform X2 [Malus sylvestris]|uniref:protein ABCI12, chloroplastic isoform X2 n=1 Tax=Malus domestica TaxID=3750 RepID=UPI0007ECE3FC|nr:protein ABCI12, chloroplastic isoform X2 [Malus domestica]XP_050119574.1 protein ABCI12, chloroplastic isoform X2 [Malus sylvestris]
MSFAYRAVTTVTFPSFPLNPNPKTLIAPNFTHPSSLNKTLIQAKPRLSLQIRAAASDSSQSPWWVNVLPTKAFGAEKFLRLISGATASPICQYVSEPTTFLHSVDPRIKLDQLGRVSLISGILFIMLGLGSDGVPPLVQLRTPPPGMMGLSNLPASLEGYSYLIMKLGPIQFTRKGLSVASTAACLTFTVFQSASLCLTTTTPEELAFALRWFMLPLTHLGVPVAEIILTLMLSLRFINLVFDEVRNVALGIVSRRINWEQLTMVETIDLLFAYFRRIFTNIFSHAEQISQAMIVRGFRGDSNAHKIYLLSDPSIGTADIISLLCLVGVIGASVWFGYFLV